MHTEKDCVTILTFTDPMMGLSYEMEPVFRKIETHFSGNIVFRTCMALLVRDVYDFIDPRDLPLGKEVALKKYNIRLADIYRQEEHIHNMPIYMDEFHLFDAEHTSSMPLNLAYKAVELIDPSRAEAFLYKLRLATVLECRQTTKKEEILNIVHSLGFDVEKFLTAYDGGSAQNAVLEDLHTCQFYGIRGLPAYLLEYKDRKVILKGVLPYEIFAKEIKNITKGCVQEKIVTVDTEEIYRLIKKHPIISPIEICHAFGEENVVMSCIQKLLADRKITLQTIHHGTFIVFSHEE